MGSYYLTPVESYAVDMLHCTKEELELLTYVYSELVDQLGIDTDEIIRHKNIHDLMYNLYVQVAGKLSTELYCVSGYQSVINKEGTGYIEFKVTGSIDKQLQKLVKVLEQTQPTYDEDKCKWYFNNFLDEVIDDWDLVETIEQDMLQYLYDNDMLVISEEDMVKS